MLSVRTPLAAETTASGTTPVATAVTQTTATAMKPLPTVQRKTPPAPAPVAAPVPRIERTTTGSPTITNVPAAGSKAKPAVASSGDLDQKYAAMARDFAAQKGGAYTVQFELVCETASVTKALSDGGSNVWFTPISFRGRPCYRVFWGRYETRDAALAGAKSVPKSLGGSAPVVVKAP